MYTVTLKHGKVMVTIETGSPDLEAAAKLGLLLPQAIHRVHELDQTVDMFPHQSLSTHN